jgi:porphobilinogen synthase
MTQIDADYLEPNVPPDNLNRIWWQRTRAFPKICEHLRNLRMIPTDFIYTFEFFILHYPVPMKFVGQFPTYRPRRLRATPALRRLVSETQLNPSQLVLPLFARSGRKLRRPIAAMPGVFQLSPDELVRDATAAYQAGVPAILLFGIPDKKDAQASGAYATNGIVQQTVRLLKKELPDLLVITDVCLCEYMEHGHCGIIGTERRTPIRQVGMERRAPARQAGMERRAPARQVEKNPGRAKGGPTGTVLNDPTLKLLAQTAASHAEAGADLIAPSDMMDGRVAAIRAQLDQDGFSDTPIMSYAAKFASAFYGPFREVAESTPQFGDRRSYQMDAGNAAEALREVALDIQEGADIVMVKPALAYLDILHRVKAEFGYPTAAYSVSAEHAMIKAAAANGWIDERAVTLESLLAMRRAGADIIITYAAVDAAKWLKG